MNRSNMEKLFAEIISADLEDWNWFVDRFIQARDTRSTMARREMRIGDRVMYQVRGGGHRYGTIVKKMQKNIKVAVEGFPGRYVSGIPSLFTLVTDAKLLERI